MVFQNGLDLSPLGLLREAPKITGFKMTRLELPKSDPTWRFALAANPSSPGFLLQIFGDDGVIGSSSVGEIQHLGYRLEDMKSALDAALPELVVNSSHSSPEGSIGSLVGPSRALVQMALLDLVARSRKVHAHQLLGSLQRENIRVTRILALKSPTEMAAVAASHIEEGYRDLKIKLDNKDSELDFNRVAAIREAVGPEVRLTVDANQSYSAEGAFALSKRIAQFDIDVFEQPVPKDDIEGMCFLREHSPIPIEADEAANSMERISELLARKAVHGVSIKIPKLGGIDRAIEVVEMCSDAGVQVRIGAHVGSRLLSAAALQLGVVIPDLVEPAELAEFERLEGDPVVGLKIENGRLTLPDDIGYGVSVTSAI